MSERDQQKADGDEGRATGCDGPQHDGASEPDTGDRCSEATTAGSPKISSVSRALAKELGKFGAFSDRQ